MDTISSSPLPSPDLIWSPAQRLTLSGISDIALGALSKEMLLLYYIDEDDTSTALVLSDLNIIFECCVVCLLLLRTRMFAMRAGKFWRRVRHCWDVSSGLVSGAQCRVSVGCCHIAMRCNVFSHHSASIASSSPGTGTSAQWAIMFTAQWATII